ncbi:MAG: PA2779 family protein [Polaromonas sp.]
MKSMTKNLTCRFLIVALMTLSFQTARAGMIGAEQAAASVQPDRVAMLSVLNRADTTAQLRAQGIDPAMASERVAAMTDEEVRTLAGNIHTAPAGGDISAGTVLAVLVIAGAVWYFAFRK